MAKKFLLDIDSFNNGGSTDVDRDVTQKFADATLEPIVRVASDEVTVHYPALTSRGKTGYTKEYGEAWEKLMERRKNAALN